MKSIKLVLFCFFILSKNLIFSEENVKNIRNEFHINSTGFVANYVNFGNNVASNNPYLLGYKRIFDNTALRVGLMGNISNSNQKVNPQQPRSYNSSKSLSLRIGYEWRKILHKRWSIFYGFDIATELLDNKSTNLQNINFNGNLITAKNISSFSNYSYGGGPLAGIQWNLSNRISLMAESRAYYFYTETHSKNKWEDVPDQLKNNNSFKDTDNINYFSNLNFNLPLDIFLIIKF